MNKELKVGDIVALKSTAKPKMSIRKIKVTKQTDDDDDGDAVTLVICDWFNRDGDGELGISYTIQSHAFTLDQLEITSK